MRASRMPAPSMRYSNAFQNIAASGREALYNPTKHPAAPASVGIMLLIWRFWNHIPLLASLKGAAGEAIKPLLRILTSFLYIFKKTKMIENGAACSSRVGESIITYPETSESSSVEDHHFKEPPRLEAFLFGSEGHDVPPQLKQLYNQRMIPCSYEAQEATETEHDAEPARLEAFLFGSQGQDVPPQLKKLYSQRMIPCSYEAQEQSEIEQETEAPRLEAFLFGSQGQEVPPQLKKLYSQRMIPCSPEAQDESETEQDAEPPRLEAFLFGSEGQPIPEQLKKLYSQRVATEEPKKEPARLEDYLFATDMNILSNGDDASQASRERRAEEVRKATEELKELQKLAGIYNKSNRYDESSSEEDSSEEEDESSEEDDEDETENQNDDPPRLEAFLFGSEGQEVPEQLKQLYSRRTIPQHEEEEPPRLEAFLFGSEGQAVPEQLKKLYSQRTVPQDEDEEPARLEDYLFATDINALSNGDDSASVSSRQRRADELKKATEELKELQKLAGVKPGIGIQEDSSDDDSEEESDEEDENEEDEPDDDKGSDESESGSEAETNNDTKAVDSSVQMIPYNLRRIHRVVKFWFGRATPDNAQKKLWMIADQSQELRQEIDKEITDEFGDLILLLATTGLWNEWCENVELYGYQGKLAIILVLDQFSRHVHRHLEEVGRLMQIPSQEMLDQVALKTAVQFIRDHQSELTSGMIPTPMVIFSLMPFRHANKMETLEYCRRQIESSANLLEQYDAMLRRFRKATNRRLAILQDGARSDGTGKEYYTDEDILEAAPFEADMTNASKHVVHRTIREFLSRRGVHPNTRYSIVVSLSGGVDSMVIAAVLAHLRNECGWPLNIVAVHIDYANRPESAAEADFVQRFCQHYGIDFRCRRIDEMHRDDTARDAYEKHTREVRYDLYRQTVASMGAKDTVGVVLGHHRGDLRENVLSNAHKGAGPLDLSGMTEVSKNDGVMLFRPLLPLEKSAVLDYAHTYGVPYFKDTTPHWSTRGKLRKKLLPLIEEVYGEGSLNNLSNLAVESDECRALLNEVAISPFMDQVEYYPMGISFPTSEWKSQSHFFWKFVLREVLHSIGVGMFSDKSVHSFLERVRAEEIREGWLACRKDVGVFLREDGTIFILKPESFPWRDQDKYDTEDLEVRFGRHNALQVGPWIVTTDLIRMSLPEKELDEWLGRKAVSSWEDFMAGSIEYFLPLPTWEQNGQFDPRPLVFRTFTKENRPLAWKSADLKIQERLPMVGNDDIALRALKDPYGAGAIHDGDKVNPTYLVKVILRLAHDQ